MSLFSRLSHIQQIPQQNANEENGSEVAESSSTVSGEPHQSSNPATPVDSKHNLQNIQAKAGILLRTLKPGDATHFPKKGDTCTIHYEAFLEEEMTNPSNNSNNETHTPEPFDSSKTRNQPFHFRLGAAQVIEGLDVAVSKMSVGQEVEVTIPYPYAYGVAGYPPVVPPRATLIFRVELIRFASVV